MAFALWACAFLLPWTQEDIRTLLRRDEAYRIIVLQSDPKRYTPLIVGALRDREPLLRRNAASALGEMDLAQNDAADREPVIFALAKAAHDSDSSVQNAAIRSLLIVLRNRQRTIHGAFVMNSDELRPLTDLGRRIVPVLDAELRSSVPNRIGMKVTAVRALAKIKGPGTLDPILFAIDHEEGFLMSEAMQAAITYKDSRVARMIVANVAKSIPSYGQTPGQWALEQMGAQAVPAMVKGLRSAHDPEAKRILANVFETVIDRRALPALIAALQDPEEIVARQAAQSLFAYPGAETIAALRRAQNDSRPRVRGAAGSSLKSLVP